VLAAGKMMKPLLLMCATFPLQTNILEGMLKL
jgi:hypothetical protein